MIRRRTAPAFLLVWLFLASPARAQETAESPKLTAGDVELQFGGLVQTQFNTSSVDSAETTDLLLRRVRFAVNAREQWVLYTPGVNVYLGRNNRLMLNYDLWDPDSGDRESSFKAQLQLAF